MPANPMPSATEFLRFAPEITLTLAGTLLMVLEPLVPIRSKSRLSILAVGAMLLAVLFSVTSYWSVQQGADNGQAFQGMLVVDGFATFFRVLVLAVAILTTLFSVNYLNRERADSAEYYALTLFSVAGQCLMVTANELIMVFIGLEISSIASYVLAGYLRDDKRNNESAVKYFLLGSFATAFLLYGIAWIYGVTGSTNLNVIQQYLAGPDLGRSVTLVGTAAALMFVGFAFKISVAPFQVWAPDVYQGAPAPVAAFLSAGPKAAAFAVFIRVFTTAFEPISDRWTVLLWVSALLTMCIGNLAALTQTNVKRILAYSSIANAGYILVAFAANSQVGTQAVMFYLAAYAFMNTGVFAVVTHIARQGERYLEVEDFAGLGTKQPMTAFLLTVFLLSLIGVPLTGGFLAKFYVFKAALDSHLVWLTILGLLNSALAAYYYLRIIMVMYMKEPGESMSTLGPLTPALRTTLWVSAAVVILLGVFPGYVMNFAGHAAGLK